MNPRNSTIISATAASYRRWMNLCLSSEVDASGERAFPRRSDNHSLQQISPSSAVILHGWLLPPLGTDGKPDEARIK